MFSPTLTFSCFSHCDCESSEEPTNEDLFKQNACYASCGEACIELEDYESRKRCISSCPCQCNQFCFQQCHAIGLKKVCNEACGCHKHHHEEEEEHEKTKKHSEDDHEHTHQKNDHDDEHDEEHSEKEAEQPAAPSEDAGAESGPAHAEGTPAQEVPKVVPQPTEQPAPVEEPTPVEQPKPAEEPNKEEIAETGELGPSAEEVSNKISALSVAAAAGRSSDVEFRDLVNEILTENDYCDPDCWRQCLQVRDAPKEATFKCIDRCGCGYESPQLMLLQTETIDAAYTGSSSGLILFFILTLLSALAGIGYYIYKREFDLKLHEDLIHEEDYEGGYEKLD